MRTTILFCLCASVACAQIPASPPAEKAQPELIRTSIRVSGPLDPGSKDPNTDLYRLTMSFENTDYAVAKVFVPHVAARAFLMHGARFRGREGAVHHYSVTVTDARGASFEKARFAVFVGGVAAGPGGELPKILDYNEELDLVRLAGQDKLERLIGYVCVPKGTPPDFSVAVTLKTDVAEEKDAEAQRLIKLAGPDRREFCASARPTPEEKRTNPRSAEKPQGANTADAIPKPPAPPRP